MKLTTETRRLKTPQETRGGKVRKNIAGEPVFTEYLKLTPSQYQDLKQHMKQYINVISNFDDSQFGILNDRIDLTEKTQIDNEPIAYSYLERLQIVLDRLDTNDDMTTGVIDMYNHVVCKTLRALDFPQSEIEDARVTIEDPEIRRMRNALNPRLFQLGDK